jgi:hypothetical protein
MPRLVSTVMWSVSVAPFNVQAWVSILSAVAAEGTKRPRAVRFWNENVPLLLMVTTWSPSVTRSPFWVKGHSSEPSFQVPATLGQDGGGGVG